MRTTHLDLYIYDKFDLKTIYIQDVSQYNPDLPVEDPILAITPPDFATTYAVGYIKNTFIPITSNAFQWTNTPDYIKLMDLPDGLWKIEQSIKPNGKMKKEFKYFRITSLKKQILDCASKLLDNACADTISSNNDIKDYFIYLQLLDSAKYMVEECCMHNEGKIIYNQVKKEFNQKCKDC